MSNGKPVLVLVHGMGQHTAESFKQEVVTAADTALKRYESYINTHFEDQVIIKSIAYDPIIEEVRKQISDAGDSVTKFLKVNGLVKGIPGLISKVSGFEQGLGDDSFANTHCLDVVLYLTNLGERIRVHVAKELVQTMHLHPGAHINVLAHSLGTAVLHDTLSKLYHHEFDPNDDVPDLEPTDDKLHSIWMVANVSRILSKFSGQKEPYRSIVKPGPNGCASLFFNCSHELDPFTWPRHFDPQKSDSWIKADIYDSVYKGYVTQSISRPNPHDIAGYIEDPRVCYRFLNQFMDFSPSNEEWIQGKAAFKTLDGMYDQLKAKWSSLQGLSDPGLGKFLKLLHQFEPTIQDLMDDA